MQKILIYGASVTAQAGDTGYFDKVKNSLESNNICHVSRIYYGGCHLDDAGFYKFEEVQTELYDYIVFEWNTTGLIQYNELKLCYLLQKINAKGSKPIFMILPQEANISKNRNAENQIIALTKSYDIPLLDMRINLDLATFRSYVRDVVHTNVNGADFYSLTMIKFFSEIVESPEKYWNKFNQLSKDDLSFLSAKVKPFDIELKSNQILKFIIKSKSSNFSEILIRQRIGPFSPVVSIEDGIFSKKISLWDVYCHYERDHYLTLVADQEFKNSFLRMPLEFVVSVLQENPKYELCRRDDVDFDIPKLVKLKEIYSIGVDFDIEILNV
jgi:hypothetical protein